VRTKSIRASAATAAAVAALALAGCSLSTSETEQPGHGADQPKGTVVVATHDSWAAPKRLLRRFTRETGYAVEIVPAGDAGTLTNKLVLTKDSPIADAVYGIDNTFASRAVDEGVLADHTPEDPVPGADRYALTGAAAGQLTPVDWSDVCVNVDDAWFADHDTSPPASLDDLVAPEYRDLFVTPGATTSSPGFAFLLATIGKYGEDGWEDYWAGLMKNGTKVTSGWSDAYEVDFTGAGQGDRPVVVSYSSSPPFTVPEGGGRPATSALLDTCFRQVEYAGVVAGAANPDGAAAFVDFLTEVPFQESLPENMYVYPVNADARLPAAWARWAPAADDPWRVDPDRIADHRDEWLRAWGDLVTR
jgi:thiamine transport system substrate-binding protein